MDREFVNEFIAGWIGGCFGLLAGHPMDTVKVRQQLYGKLTITKCLKNTYKYEGVRGFFKGMGFPMLATGTLNSIFFGIYGNSLRLTGDEQPSYSNVFWAGCLGGVAQLIVAVPVDLVKIKMQMQTGNGAKSWVESKSAANYKGPISCLRDVYRKGKLPGCYKGTASMAIRDVPSFGLYMVIYEAFIRATSGTEDQASPLGLVFSGGMAGALSWITIVPLDVIKSRIQADDPVKPKYNGFMDCLRKSVREEGLRVFTRGGIMVTLRAFPTNGAIFLGYVTTKNLLSGPPVEQKLDTENKEVQNISASSNDSVSNSQSLEDVKVPDLLSNLEDNMTVTDPSNKLEDNLKVTDPPNNLEVNMNVADPQNILEDGTGMNAADTPPIFNDNTKVTEPLNILEDNTKVTNTPYLQEESIVIKNDMLVA